MSKHHTAQLRSLLKDLQEVGNPNDRQKLFSALLAEADVLDKKFLEGKSDSFTMGYNEGYDEGYTTCLEGKSDWS